MLQESGFPSTVNLNVGGNHFTTSVQTLTRDPNSMLAAMFSGKSEMKPSEDGSFFIDRDGTHFRFILNYLRTGKLTLPEGATFLKELQEEAEFYQIQGILKELKLMSDSLVSWNAKVVKLNVGGHHFTTSLQTLTNDPSSMLAAMFSGRMREMKPSNDGSFFIDRDGKHFRFILNYLRTGELILPEGATFLKELEAEAEFYNIQRILDDLRLKSEILTNEGHRSLLLGWLPPKDAIGKLRRLCLLFRASRDGFATETFHSKCDNKGPTVTIVECGDNIFGGFTEKSWHSKSGQDSRVQCSEVFLFSMVNPQGLGPTKIPANATGSSNEIHCCSSYGPTFGRKHDLHIAENANINTSSYSNLCNSYSSILGQQSTFFTGALSFAVTNYEVFGLLN